MTSEKYKTKTIEEFTNNLILEQIKEQILYNRLYHKLRKKRKRTRTLLEEQNQTRT